MTVEINGDLETQRVAELGTVGSYAEYFLLLENSFSEPLLMHTHFNWYTMLLPGYGKIRSYGRRVVSEAWSNREFSSMYGEGRTQGLYGNTRFLTQLRTGYYITACGQTRQINSIQSDVEMTIDRPFTLGNREFHPISGTDAEASDLHVRVEAARGQGTAEGVRGVHQVGRHGRRHHGPLHRVRLVAPARRRHRELRVLLLDRGCVLRGDACAGARA